MTYRVRKRSHRIGHELYLWMMTFLFAVAIAACILIFVGERTSVSGSSMEPALSDKDQVIMDKLTYRIRDPKRYEIIVFPGPDQRYYVKRVIALPGESVRIQDGKVFVNDRQLKECGSKYRYTTNGQLNGTIKLNGKEYFVMGDNRSKSEDSRYDAVGPVDGDTIVGRVVFRMYPWKKIGIIGKGEI